MKISRIGRSVASIALITGVGIASLAGCGSSYAVTRCGTSYYPHVEAPMDVCDRGTPGFARMVSNSYTDDPNYHGYGHSLSDNYFGGYDDSRHYNHVTSTRRTIYYKPNTSKSAQRFSAPPRAGLSGTSSSRSTTPSSTTSSGSKSSSTSSSTKSTTKSGR